MKIFKLLTVVMLISLAGAALADVDVCTKVSNHYRSYGSGVSLRIKREAKIPRKSPRRIKENLNIDTNNLVSKLDEVLKFRTESAQTFAELKSKLLKNEPLRSSDIKKLYEQAALRLKIRTELLETLVKYRCTVYRYSIQAFEKSNRGWAFKVNALVLASRLIMDDNFRLSTVLYEDTLEFRRVLNQGNPVYGVSEDNIREETKLFYSVLNMEDKYRMMDIYSAGKKKYRKYRENKPDARRDTHLESLIKIIETSPTFNSRKISSFGAELRQDLRFFGAKFFTGQHRTRDMMGEIGYGFIWGLAFAFGRTIAQIQWKDGKLLHNKSVENDILSQMKPGDVLWDKSRYKVSGRIISLTGFWNHNAIYLGTEEQLKELGIWEHPLVQPYQQKIQKGKVIIEALGPGVVMNTLAHFLNIDDIAVARKKNITPEKAREAVLLAISNMGKSYDYVFDTNSELDIICSELVMVAYPEIDFEQDRMIGNWTTNPDLLSKETFDNGSFEPFLLYYSGKKVYDNFEYHMKTIAETGKIDPEYSFLLPLEN